MRQDLGAQAVANGCIKIFNQQQSQGDDILKKKL